MGEVVGMPAPADRYIDAAKRLIAKLQEFEAASLDDAVGDDEAKIREEVVAEWLRQEFGK